MIMQEDSATKKEVRTDEPTREGIRQLIAVRAYEMWENQGRQHGCDLNSLASGRTGDHDRPAGHIRPSRSGR